MGDDELAAIRARRLAELKGNGPSMPTMSGLGGLTGTPQSDDKAKNAEEMRRNMLYQVLDNSARERLARIKIVKPEKAHGVEEMILRMAQQGQIRQKVSEKELIDLLGNISEQTSNAPKITFNRRVAHDDDDEEDWGL